MSTQVAARPNPLPRWIFAASFIPYLLLRVYLGLMPGYAIDTELYKTWALSTTLDGVANGYGSTSICYPPLYLYLVRPAGGIYFALHPELLEADVARLPWDELIFRMPGGKTYRSKHSLWADYPGRQFEAEPLPDSALLGLLIKAPSLLFDLVIAGILYQLVASGGTWGPSRGGPGWGRLAAAVYLWNPTVLYVSAWYGTPDSIHSAFVLGSLALMGAGRLAGSGVSLALGGMMKPLAAPFVPMLAVFAAARHGIRGFVLAGAGGVAGAVLVLLPFLLAGEGPSVIDRIFNDIDSMPFTTVNGHNFWWIVGGWAWVSAKTPVALGLSPKWIGIAMFGVAHLTLLVASRKWLSTTPDSEAIPADRVRLLVLGAAIMSSFFFLATHMHENHFFTVIPLLLAVAGWDRRLALLAGASSLICVINCILHDWDIPYALGLLSTPSLIENPQFGSGVMYTWVQLIGGYTNSIGAGLVTLTVCALAAGWTRRQLVDPDSLRSSEVASDSRDAGSR